jgi:hypothetical protein
MPTPKSKKSPRDEGRIRRAVQGADERAALNLRVIGNARDKGMQVTRDALASGLIPGGKKWPGDAWPVHSLEKRSPSVSIEPPEEGRARLAYNRNEAGVPLSPDDWAMLEKYPDGGPWQQEWEEACARYQASKRVE